MRSHKKTKLKNTSFDNGFDSYTGVESRRFLYRMTQAPLTLIDNSTTEERRCFEIVLKNN